MKSTGESERNSLRGAWIVTSDNRLVVEGKLGEGDSFMKGVVSPQKLPKEIKIFVAEAHKRASALLGPVRFEWVFDGTEVWIVQLHRGITQSTADVLVPGDASHWVSFDVEWGLEQLRATIAKLEPGAGLILRGEVGLTSHVADVVRRAGVPAKLQAKVH